MKTRYLEHMEKAMALAERMIQMAGDGEAICDDDRCLLVYSYILGCA